jgi:predicted metal-binding membrane protein
VFLVFSIRRMNGMDMGVATPLGSFAFFAVIWVAMMAAMMLPAAVPAVLRRASDGAGAVLLFVALYLVVWTLFGFVVYMVYRPHGPLAAGVITIAAGIYELTPLKRFFRRRCLENARSGFLFGLDCVESSIGLMLMLFALGVMSVTWTFVIGVIIAAQKFLRPRVAIDVPVALAIVGFGVLIVAAPSWAPGLMSTMAPMAPM